MTSAALGLVLVSAVCHAVWNLVAKRVQGGTVFVWLVNIAMVVLYTPLVVGVWLLGQPTLMWREVGFIAVSGLLQMAYFMLLTRGYQMGDLSVVYPLARGTGPMLSTLTAILLLGERPNTLGLLGVVCIGVGVFIFMGGWGELRTSAARQAMLYALVTGACIASYTIWDKYGVAVLDIHPLLYNWITNIYVSFYMLPLVWGQRQALGQVWGEQKWAVLTVAWLSPLAYILVLIALTVSPVSAIAPLREISILVGAVLGTVFLGEREAKRRWTGAAVIVVGVIGIALDNL